MAKVLICPLNWGIGHATRCMPIVQGLRNKGHDVVLASDGEALKLLRLEYPDLPSYELTSYSVRYPTENIVLNLSIRIPKILRAIHNEARKIAELVDRENIDVIISDNRFGCHYKGIKNIFITHQINLITGHRILDSAVRSFNAKQIGKFDECWVPDYEKWPGLSGLLGHKHDLDVRYIGPISRMKPMDVEQRFDFSVVLSGPEPQRSKLEEELILKVGKTQKKVAFVGGNFSDDFQLNDLPPNINYFKLLDSAKLNEVYCASGFVVCRSGYSSMMDLAVLGKKAVIIPTPGQTEQEYLGELYETQKWHLLQRQGPIDFSHIEQKLVAYSGIPKIKSFKAMEDALISI